MDEKKMEDQKAPNRDEESSRKRAGYRGKNSTPRPPQQNPQQNRQGNWQGQGNYQGQNYQANYQGQNYQGQGRPQGPPQGPPQGQPQYGYPGYGYPPPPPGYGYPPPYPPPYGQRPNSGPDPRHVQRQENYQKAKQKEKFAQCASCEGWLLRNKMQGINIRVYHEKKQDERIRLRFCPDCHEEWAADFEDVNWQNDLRDRDELPPGAQILEEWSFEDGEERGEEEEDDD